MEVGRDSRAGKRAAIVLTLAGYSLLLSEIYYILMYIESAATNTSPCWMVFLGDFSLGDRHANEAMNERCLAPQASVSQTLIHP